MSNMEVEEIIQVLEEAYETAKQIGTGKLVHNDRLVIYYGKEKKRATVIIKEGWDE